MLLRALSALVASFGRLIRMDNKVGSRREEHLQCAQTVFGKFEITVTFHIKCQPEFDSVKRLNYDPPLERIIGNGAQFMNIRIIINRFTNERATPRGLGLAHKLVPMTHFAPIQQASICVQHRTKDNQWRVCHFIKVITLRSARAKNYVQ